VILALGLKETTANLIRVLTKIVVSVQMFARPLNEISASGVGIVQIRWSLPELVHLLDVGLVGRNRQCDYSWGSTNPLLVLC